MMKNKAIELSVQFTVASILVPSVFVRMITLN